MNRYETHVVTDQGMMRVIITNKWTGETFACCLKAEWVNLGIPKEPTTTFIRLDEPIEPTPTIRFELIEPTPTN